MTTHHLGRVAVLPALLFALVLGCLATAQTPGPATLPTADHSRQELEGNEPFTPERFSVHFQGTIVPQGHPGFHSPYSGPNSLSSFAELRTSYTTTIFAGAALPWPGGEVYADPEMAAGLGIGHATGIAGFPNGEITRVGNPEPTVYLARAFYRQALGFGGERENVEADENQLATSYDVSRLTVTVGKISATDQFDNNAYSHDPRTQFLNWSLMDNGAWDYPADVRGYTIGGTVELNQPKWALRYGLFMEPSRANGPHFDYHVGSAFAQALEYEWRYELSKQPGKLRLLGFFNRAKMGDYAEAARLSPPDITQTRRYSPKYGFGVNLEQQLASDVGLFLRLGWDDAHTEDFAFTEIDRTASLGMSIKGTRWGRPDDTWGLAGVVNGLSGVHRRYLERGGIGFIIGDGRLNYDAEEIAETYYSAKVFKYVYLSGDAQFVNRPAYNRDRGPVSVFAIRLHVQY